jgi:hypothetical protein
VVTRPNGEWLRLKGAGPVVHIEKVLPKATHVLARVGAEAGDPPRGDAASVLGHGRQDSGHAATLDSTIVLATRLAARSRRARALASSSDLSIRQIQKEIAGRRGVVGEITKRIRATPAPAL